MSCQTETTVMGHERPCIQFMPCVACNGRSCILQESLVSPWGHPIWGHPNQGAISIVSLGPHVSEQHLATCCWDCSETLRRGKQALLCAALQRQDMAVRSQLCRTVCHGRHTPRKPDESSCVCQTVEATYLGGCARMYRVLRAA